MAYETELKLALPEKAQRAFLRHPLLKQTTGKQTHRVMSLYYDTPELALHQQGIALRLRAQGRRWLQTVKCTGQAAGGLSARPEWETPYTGHFDFSAIDDPKVRQQLEKASRRGMLAPIFETSFQRSVWEYAPAPEARITIVLDRGWIVAAGQREAISEIELELLDGTTEHLFMLANRLAERLPVTPATASKADRGYRLFARLPTTPTKARSISVGRGEAPMAAFKSIALACLDHLLQNHAGALGAEDPEYIHQMRVAVRRLRAALRLFRPLLPAGLSETLAEPLRELMDVLGKARDFDVLLEEIVLPVQKAHPDEPRLAALAGIVTERRFEWRKAALAFLRSPRFGRLCLQLLAILHARTESQEKVGAGATAPSLGAFAGERLRRLRKKVLSLAAQATMDEPASLHRLRIGIKRLRYALEYFAPLAQPKAMRRILGELTLLQDRLGQINDLANAGRLLLECAGSEPRLREAVALIDSWHGPRQQKLLAEIPARLQRLRKLRLPELVN